MKLFDHQVQTALFLRDNPRTFVTSDPGTGKTVSVLTAYDTLRKQGKVNRMLVVAPLSILQPAWGDDIEKFYPHLSYGLSVAGKRDKAFADDMNQIVMINHDGVKWITENIHVMHGFDMICVDEFTAYKNKSTQRSKAMRKLCDMVDRVVLLSGTPHTNTVCDIWHPSLMLDKNLLGDNFFRFRCIMCTPKQTGPQANMVQWIDKDDAEEKVAALLHDVTIRFKLEDCIDMPEHVVTKRFVELPAQVMSQYQQLQEESVLFAEEGIVNAVHAGARAKKLLQVCTGAVYDNSGEVVKVHQQRYELVMELVHQRECSVVAFNWRHEREALEKLAQKMKIRYAVIDGTVSQKKRTEIVEDFQKGMYQVVFCHPQSAGHGLTLTRATTTIWCSPTYNAEHYQQFNRRIYRAGQTKRTETICICASGTKEEDVYEKLATKLESMEELLHLFAELTKEAA